MKLKRITAALLAAVVTTSSFTVDAFADGVTDNTAVSTENDAYSDYDTDVSESSATGSYVKCTTLDDLQSKHPYDDDSDITYVYTDASCKNLKLTFSEDTEFESGYDYLSVYDGNDNIIGEYSGTELAGDSVKVPGNTVKLRLTSDGSSNYYGFKVESVENIDNVPKQGDPEYDYVIGAEAIVDTSEYLYYLKKYRGAGGDVVIPSVVDGKKIEVIGNSAFSGNATITSVEIPDGVTSIYSNAFNNCTSLETVTIPSSVISIGSEAFNNCTSLETVTIPSSVISIGSEAFNNCKSFKTVTIPASVTNIGDNAFGYYEDTDTWETKKIDGFKINYVKNTSGHLYAAQNGFTDEACLITNELDDGTLEIDGYFGNDKAYVIPAEINGKKVTEIGSYAFSGCGELTSVTIPDGVKYIRYDAFNNCTSLETVTIPSSVISIGSEAFNNCKSFKTVTIPASVTDIGEQAFYNCTSLKTVTIPASVTNIGDNAFGYYEDTDTWETKKVDGFKINYVKNTSGHLYAAQNGFTDEACIITNELDDGTLEIDRYAGNSATYAIPSVIDGKKVTGIDSYAFSGCTELTSITIPDSITYIGYDAFYNCTSLETVTIPDGVTSIYDSAFYDCTSLKAVTIPESVTSISSNAFYNCTSLKEVTIPASVTNIGDNAFGYYEDTDTWETKKIDGFKINYVKNTSGHLYAAQNGFTDEACLITNELDDGTLEIYKYFGNDKEYVIPDEIDGKKVTEIGSYAFSNCTELTSVTIPDGVTYISYDAFDSCTSLETITIPASVTSIGYRAFNNCTSLKSITIPASVTYIDSEVFYNCTSLKTVTIPASVTYIGDNAFGYYEDTDTWETKKVDGFKINYVKNTRGHLYATQNGFTDEACLITNELDDGTLEIYKYFGNDKEYVIPDEIDGKKVTSIDDSAFRDCTDLTSVTIPDSVTSIGDRAFYSTSLKSVTIPASVTYIGDEAFGYYYDDNDGEVKKVDGFKINYVKNTYGHYYAAKNGFTDEACIITNELDDGTLEISYYAGNSATYVIPGEIDGKKVTGIDSSAFSGCTELTSITIPDSITYIENDAFYNCTSLETVIIPVSVTYIDSEVFYNCKSLKTVTIPASVTDIYNNAFYNCTSLKEVTIPASVTYIGSNAFGYYYDYDDDEEKTVDGFKINYTKNTWGHWYATKNGFSDEACLVVNELDDGTLEIDRYAGNSATYAIPSVIDGKKVTGIDSSAFSGCTELTSITIPDSVSDIGGNAFYGCTSLKSVTIPNGVTNIYGSAFYDCTSLKSVTIPESVTYIEDYAFGYYEGYDADTDSWGSKKVNGFKINYVKNTYGHYYAAKNGFTDEACIITNELDDGTLEIDRYAGNSATYAIPSVIDGKKVTGIDSYAFSGCTELTSITIPDSITYIRYDAFYSCTSLETVIIPVSVTYIDSEVFYNCTSLKTVTIPESVTEIGEWAFNNCTSLETITIPASVTDIYYNAFYNCTSLKEVTIPASVTYIGSNAFGYYYDYDDDEEKTVDGFKINYTKNTWGHWYATKNGFSDEACLVVNELDDGTLEIDRYAGNSATYAIPSVIDGKKVTGIDSSAFSGCTELTSITIPDSITYIENNAFYNCTSLKEVTIPASVTYIGDEAFGYYSDYDEDYNYVSKIDGFKINYTKNTWGHWYATKNGFSDEACLVVNELDDGTLEIDRYAGNSATYAIPSVIDGKKVTGIDSSAFSGCTELTSITIPDGVTYIGDYAFNGCTELTSITIPDSVSDIGGNAFYGCTSLKSVTIPESVTYISGCAFADCTSLETVTIPNGVTDICWRAFYDCVSLKSVTIPASVTYIDDYAFGYYEGYDADTDLWASKKVDGFKISCYKDTAGEQYAKDYGFDYEILDGETQCTHSNTEIRNAKSADCTTDGYTGDTYCVDCDKLISSGEVIPATGHTEVIDEAVEATCTKTGLTEGSHCSVCNTVIKAQEVIPAKGHTEVIDKAVEATCTKTGLTEGKHCSVCDAIIKAQEVVPAKGHTEVIDKAVAATCTKTGLTEGKHCSVCGATIKAQETVPATGHKYVDTIVKPTYTAQGYTLHKCSVCGASKKDTYTAKLTLAKVTGVKLGGRAADALRINWTKNANADGYIVEMYQGGKWVRVAKITNNSTTTFRKAGLKAGTAYKFRVRAYKMSGKTAVYGAYSATVAARTNPSVMTGAKLGGRAADALRVNWSKNASADGYIVEMYQGNKWVRVAKITSNNTTTFRKAGLKAGTAYKFRVKAYKMSGKTALYGNYSATVAARTNPSVIKGAKLTGRAADALRINWTKNASADGYIVEMYQGNKWVRVAKITNNSTTTFRKAGLKASTVYKFRVRAYKMSGKTALYGNYSATVTARTNPSIVKGVKIGGKAKDALRVNWTKNTSAQGYIVEMYKGGKWVRVAKITNGNTTTFRKSGLAKNTSYRFRVCAYYMSGSTPLYGTYVSVIGKTAAD